MISLAEALRKIHFPKDKTEIEDAQKRLAFDELFLLQLQAQNIRQRLKAKTAISINFLEKETKKFVDSLPFKLTDAQRKAAWEILRDIARAQPMSRILEGDVGSGKTIVAGIALFNTAMNKRQAVLMAPTEILAIQHYETLIKLFSATPLKIALITANKKISNEIIPEKAKSGNKKSKTPSLPDLIKNSSILVGTHALIQDKINFTDLSLVIVDEQHRFGVKQRQKLTAISANSLNHKDIIPHFLSMTATPIPRSLALAMFGEVDISLINQMPQGRKPILTRVVDEQNRFKAYEFLREKIKDGRQAFVICPLIDPSDKLGIKSVTEEYARLNRDVFPEFTIGLLHGKLKSAEKEKIMEDFKKNKIKILVSTSIVEVGVDIPNASIMMIEGADRFGLAQLHQFRGRVGRGEHQSFCFLFAESNSPKTKERLKALEKYSDGFALSKIDLKFRGPGEIYGTAQSGFPELKIASLFDYALMKKALDWAKKIIENDPKLERYPLIKNKLDTLGDNTHLE
jgi:ATP-dependent DNA helicase RecG